MSILHRQQVLKHHALVEWGDNEGAIVTGEETVLIHSDLLSLFKQYRHILSLLPFASRSSSTSDSESLKILDKFCNDNNLYFEPRDAGLVKSSGVVKAFQNAFAMWKPLLSNHEFFTDMSEDRNAALMYLVEKVWFVSKVDSYLEPAIKNAKFKDKSLSFRFESLLNQEREHFLPLLTALELDQDFLDNYEPTMGGHLFLSHLQRMAHTQPESLYINLGLLESDSESKDDVLESYGMMEKLTGLSLKPFKEHYLLDLNEGHGEAWANFILERDCWDISILNLISSDIHITKHAIDSWHDSLFKELKARHAHFTTNLHCTKPLDFFRSKIYFSNFDAY